DRNVTGVQTCALPISQTPGGQQAGPSGSTSGGRKVIAGQTTPTKFGQGGQSQTGAVSGTPVAGAGAAGGAALGAAGAAAKPRPGQRPAAQAPAAPAGTGRPAPSRSEEHTSEL